MVGHTVSRYKILSKLGGGGMGVVYEAEDTELHRRVALKFLPDDRVPAPETLDRFKREARAASALNHPYICTVYDIGLHDGRPYIVMERLHGTTLQRVINGKPIPIEQIAALGGQIADALGAAHAAGIIHRDLKPANVFVTDRGDAKILDFGVAKITTPAEDVLSAPDAPTVANEHHTIPGTTVGTIAYMSPEQARGEPVDARSDLFSLGAVLYEMATGRPPFTGPTPAVVFDGILHKQVSPPSRSNPAIPPAFDTLILTVLEKDRSARVQNAREVRAILKQLSHDSAASPTGLRGSTPQVRQSRRLLTAAVAIAMVTAGLVASWSLGILRTGPPPELASIAVLPFIDMSQAKDQEYFSDGLSEELIAVLVKVPQLRVIGRTSSFQFKGKSEDLREIAAKLGVDHLLEGSVRKERDRVRITAQLIRASDGSNLWSETYNRTMIDVFKVQDDIAQAAAQAMKVTLLADQRASRTTPYNSEAQNLYLEGRYFRQRRTQGDYERAANSFKKALEIDQGFAPAWAGLAWVYALQAGLGQIPAESGSKQARDAAQRALGLDSSLLEAHTAMVYVLTGYDWDWTGAEAEVKEVLALDPGNADAMYSAGLLARTLGRFDEAIDYYREALARDPLSPSVHNNLGLAFYYAGRLQEAETEIRKLLELRPGIAAAQAHLSKILLARGLPDRALAAIEDEPSAAWRAIGLPLIYHALGRRSESDAALRALTETFADDWAYQIAEVHAFRGEIDEAFSWLERAYVQRDGGFSEFKGDPLLKNLETDQRHAALLRKLKLPLN